MAMKNYKVTHEDGTETYYQFDESEPAGKAGLEALHKAAKSKDSDIKSVTQADPKAA
jgi:hypothetical protein